MIQRTGKTMAWSCPNYRNFNSILWLANAVFECGLPVYSLNGCIGSIGYCFPTIREKH